MYKLCITFELPSLETIPCWERMKQLSNPQEGLVIRSTGSNTHTHNKTHEDFFLRYIPRLIDPLKYGLTLIDHNHWLTFITGVVLPIRGYAGYALPTALASSKPNGKPSPKKYQK